MADNPYEQQVSDTDKASDAPLVVIAIGGNSLIKDDKHRTVLDQYNAVGETARHIVPIVAEGYRVVITHGNGPQVGFILMRSDLARECIAPGSAGQLRGGHTGCDRLPDHANPAE